MELKSQNNKRVIITEAINYIVYEGTKPTLEIFIKIQKPKVDSVTVFLRLNFGIWVNEVWPQHRYQEPR